MGLVAKLRRGAARGAHDEYRLSVDMRATGLEAIARLDRTSDGRPTAGAALQAIRDRVGDGGKNDAPIKDRWGLVLTSTVGESNLIVQ